MKKQEIWRELAQRELARRSFAEYLAYVQGRMWKRTRMAEFLAGRVQAFLETETGHAYDILLIETPPQHGKSMTVTELTSCRLTQSYYWVIGDNRAGMSDSRSFGVLPHSHLIGKGVCIGYSRNPEKPFWQSLRTDRFFKTEL